MGTNSLVVKGARLRGWIVAAVVAATCWQALKAWAQESVKTDPATAGKPATAEAAKSVKESATPVTDPNVVQAGCSTCSGGALGGQATIGAAGCGDGCCVPGRFNDCCGCSSDTVLGRIFGGFVECLCCPDPCYVPTYVPAADAAFFADAPRPRTRMMFRWDTGFDLTNPDRAEYFWAREHVGNSSPGKGIKVSPTNIDYQELMMRAEVGSGAFGFFIDTPYRHYDLNGVPQAVPAANMPPTPTEKSGFTDLIIGTKSLLLDCELLQVAFEFKTTVPSGDFTNGLGTGHVALEPSILFALKLTPDCYLQGQLAYWIPIGGDSNYQGNIYHTHLSYNHVLWRPSGNVQLVGTVELMEWTIINGEFTDPGLAAARTASTTFVSAGPGIRLFICEKVDVGVGSAFSISGSHWAQEMIRAEFRWSF